MRERLAARLAIPQTPQTVRGEGLKEKHPQSVVREVRKNRFGIELFQITPALF